MGECRVVALFCPIFKIQFYFGASSQDESVEPLMCVASGAESYFIAMWHCRLLSRCTGGSIYAVASSIDPVWKGFRGELKTKDVVETQADPFSAMRWKRNAK